MDVLTQELLPLYSGTIPNYDAGYGPGLVRKLTKTAGTPVARMAGGLLEIPLAAAAEVENHCVYNGDDLNIDIDDVQQLDVWAKLSGTLAAGFSVAFGLASARNDAIDSIAAHALFRVIGAAANPVTCETDDGTNDNDDKAAGLNLGTTLKRFTIDFASGVKTLAPPGASVGGKGSVLFSMDDDRFNLRPVCRTTQFDMSNYSGGLQFFAQFQKTATAGAATLYIARARLRRKYSA